MSQVHGSRRLLAHSAEAALGLTTARIVVLGDRPFNALRRRCQLLPPAALPLRREPAPARRLPPVAHAALQAATDAHGRSRHRLALVAHPLRSAGCGWQLDGRFRCVRDRLGATLREGFPDHLEV